jgi:transaldolase
VLSMYIDSAVREDVEPLLRSGIYRGVTTNPVLLQRAGLRTRDLKEFYEWATAAGAEEVFFQAWGEDERELTACGEQLLAIGSRVVVKIAANQPGVRTAAALSGSGFPVLLTAVYNAPQAMLAAAAKVTYVAPYLGRMGDAGRPAHAEVVSMARALRGVGSPTKLLVASVRSPGDVVQLAQEGISCFALSPAVARAFFAESLTDEAVQTFERASRATNVSD